MQLSKKKNYTRRTLSTVFSQLCKGFSAAAAQYTAHGLAFQVGCWVINVAIRPASAKKKQFGLLQAQSNSPNWALSRSVVRSPSLAATTGRPAAVALRQLLPTSSPATRTHQVPHLAIHPFYSLPAERNRAPKLLWVRVFASGSSHKCRPFPLTTVDIPAF